jgi:UDP-3-O-[3-hydroxymyristoyl] glucosamine N-acyltransferase
VPSTVSDLATLVQGRVHGPADRVVHVARTLQEAGPDDVSFVENERHLKDLKTCRAGVLVVSKELAARPTDLAGPPEHGFVLIEAADPLAAFVTIYQHLQGRPAEPPSGISPQAVIHPTAKIGPGCTVMPFAVVGANATLGARCTLFPGAYVGADCILGDDVVLHAHAVLYDRCVLGARVTVHANAVLGADGFGYRFAAGKHAKVPQLGHVEVGDDVEIGACTTIDRGTFQATRIGSGTKIDNLVQIGHNCQIGKHNLLCGLVGIAGSCTTGDYVVLAGGVGIADHVNIGDRTVVGARGGVGSDLKADMRVVGAPARPEREALRIIATMERLPDMWRDLRQLKQQVELLTAPQPEQERKAG